MTVLLEEKNIASSHGKQTKPELVHSFTAFFILCERIIVCMYYEYLYILGAVLPSKGRVGDLLLNSFKSSPHPD